MFVGREQREGTAQGRRDDRPVPPAVAFTGFGPVRGIGPCRNFRLRRRVEKQRGAFPQIERKPCLLYTSLLKKWGASHGSPFSSPSAPKAFDWGRNGSFPGRGVCFAGVRPFFGKSYQRIKKMGTVLQCSFFYGLRDFNGTVESQ